MSIIKELSKYFSLVKFAHTIFALPFAFIGFTLAICEPGSNFTWVIFVQILCCMVFARNSAMGFNRYADRVIDAMNPRTSKREIPSGRLSPKSVIIFTIVNIILFLASAYSINFLCFLLAFPALAVVLGYSYLKRFSYMCHYVLGLSLSIAPIGAFVAVTGYFTAPALILSGIVFLWASGFDILYSLPDEEIDKKQNLHSIPGRFGRIAAMRISIFTHALIIPLLVWYFFVSGAGFLFIIGAVFFVGLLVYQHLIISPKDLRRLNSAFFTSNGIASLIFAVFAILDKVC